MSCFLTNSSLGKKLVMSLTGCFLLLELERFKINIAAVDRDIERSAAVKELLLVLCGDQLLLVFCQHIECI